MITLYDLVGKDDRRFSPHCWRTKMALAHKGLAFETNPTRFTDIPSICGGGQKTVPVLEDGDKTVADSWAIAGYLEERYPDRPSLSGGQVALTLFVQSWAGSRLHPALIRLIVFDIYEHLDPADRDYFRETREKRFGTTLEAMQEGREEALPVFQAALDPLRHTLHAHDFLGGDAPLYADYLVFGTLQWARTISPFRLLEEDDPVLDWFDRCLDLHDGLGRAAPGCD